MVCAQRLTFTLGSKDRSPHRRERGRAEGDSFSRGGAREGWFVWGGPTTPLRGVHPGDHGYPWAVLVMEDVP